MIRSDTEHARALEQIAQEEERLAAEEQRLLGEFSADEVEALMDPLRTFHAQLVDEVKVYERLKRGDLGDLTNLRGAGRLLVHLRIAAGITQRELAERLGVHESQVSRDERNEYHGVTLDRASKVMDAIGAQVKTSVVTPHVDSGVGGEPLMPSGKVGKADADYASAA